MNIPIPEYCTLERASKLIGCDVSDLIHLGEIGAIKICISLNYEVLADLSVLLSDEQSVSYEDDEGWVGGFYSKFVTKEDPEIESNKDRGWYNFTAVISGLWEIHKVSEYGKLENKFPNSISNLLISIDGDYAYASAKLVDLVIDFDVNKLFILGVDIKKIMEFEGKRIPCPINEFEGEFDTNIVTNSTRKPPVANEEKTKTINARAQFIKSLLYTMYDQDIADNPRKYFENPDSEISRLFQAKNIKAPSGRTVQAWLNMVDIPFIDEKP